MVEPVKRTVTPESTPVPRLYSPGETLPRGGAGAGAYTNIIPAANLVTVTPRETLAKSSTKAADRQQTIAGENVVGRIIYGRDVAGGQIAGVLNVGSDLYLLAVWAYGECQAIESVKMWDAVAPAGVQRNDYLGTQVQGIDGLLAYAALNQSVAKTGRAPFTYADTLPGWCYSVFKIPASVSNGFPTIKAVIQGRKVASGAGGSGIAYSNNPAYCLADFIENTDYGMGRQVDWTSVAAVAAICNQTLSPTNEKRRTVGLSLVNVQDSTAWMNTLAAYAGCMVHQEANTIILVPNAAASSEYSFDKTNIVESSLKLAKSGTANIPTVVKVTYTDESVFPWRDYPAVVYGAGVLAGTVPRRESQVSMPGVHSYSQAMREAIERLNALTLCDLGVEFDTFDSALSLQRGRVFDVTHPIGLTAKLFRATRVDDRGFGRYHIAGTEYDPASYSDTVTTAPTYLDTNLPLPTNPPTVTGLTAVEELYQGQDGFVSSRIRATWTPIVFAPQFNYEVTVNGVASAYLLTGNSEWVSGGVRQDDTYRISVAVRTNLAVSTAATFSLLAKGKLLPPQNVPFFTGYESGGEVRLEWIPAPDIDLTGHEIRYGSAGGTWATSSLLDRVAMPARRYYTRVIPPGVTKFYIVGLDSVRTDPNFPSGLQSPTPTTTTFTINTNPDLFMAGSYPFASPSLTLMLALPNGSGGTKWVSNKGGTFNAKFPGNFNAAAPNIVDSYQDAGTCELLSDTINFGYSVTGLFVFSVAYTDLSGTATLYIETSPNNTDWTQYTGATSVNATAQYLRFRLQTTGTMLVTSLGSVTATVATLKETGQVTSSAGGPVTVTLVNKYAKLKTLQLTGQDAGGVRNPVYLNGIFSFDPRYFAIGYADETYCDQNSNPTNQFDVLNYNVLGNPDVGVVQYLIEGVVR